jgi:hypothetical protein
MSKFIAPLTTNCRISGETSNNQTTLGVIWVALGPEHAVQLCLDYVQISSRISRNAMVKGTFGTGSYVPFFYETGNVLYQTATI